MKIKKGTVLIAIDECKMKLGGHKALVIGKEYKVLNNNDNYFVIESEIDFEHQFTLHDANKYFKIKDQSELELERKENQSATAVEWLFNTMKNYVKDLGHETEILDILLPVALKTERLEHSNTWNAAIKEYTDNGFKHYDALNAFFNYKIK